MREYRQRVRENPARHQVYRERQRKYMKTYHEKRKLMGRNAFFCSDDWIVGCVNSAEVQTRATSVVNVIFRSFSYTGSETVLKKKGALKGLLTK